MAKQVVDGENAVMMVLESVQDVDDDALAIALSAVLNRPVAVLSDDSFEIDWGEDE